jgi:2-isopropylmalate synthase
VSADPPGDHPDEGVTHRHRGAAPHSHVGHDHVALPGAIDVYDTTLRDGAQQEGMSLTVEDKLRVAEQLDHLGVAYVEGGWPGANPKDVEFFARARNELKLSTATLVAFGSTRRPKAETASDETLRHLVAAGTEVVCIVAKSSDLHVTEALRTDLDEAVAMVEDSVAFLRSNGLRVFLDAEHFFDGYRRDRDFALRVLDAAERRGAEALVLCDTNGGTLPDDVERIVSDVRTTTSATIGVHFHNDSGCAVANSLIAVRVGATQVQGCVNGYGERAGNADLSAAIPNLTLKMGVETIPRERLTLITPVARHIAELVNVNLDPQRPYVGTAAFAHKAGLHASAIARHPDAYHHVEPASVGNGTRFVVSELAGRSTLALKATELGIELDSEGIDAVLEALKRLEHAGYHFEVADGSLELLMRAAAGGVGAALDGFFTVESFRVSTDWRASSHTPSERASERLVHPWAGDGELITEATVKIHVAGHRVVATAEGNGPVNALDAALRQAIGPYFPELATMHLTDYRVRVLDSASGTAAMTRVLLDTADPDGSWSTIGVSENVIESSWHALVDAVVFGLLRASAVASNLPAEA